MTTPFKLNDTSITTLNIPASVTDIDVSFLAQCPNLVTIVVDADNTHYTSIGGVLFNKTGDELLRCPLALSGHYEVPDGVKSIADRAFYGCKSITGIFIYSSTDSIGDEAFKDCVSIKTFSISSRMKWIGARAFMGCKTLYEVKAYINTHIFDGGVGIFSGCDRLEHIILNKGRNGVEFLEKWKFEANQQEKERSRLAWVEAKKREQLAREEADRREAKEEVARREDERKSKVKAQRREANLCELCGKPLAFFARLFRKTSHPECREFKEP
jgi:BspA type Leucine rich repeat region (6 copies)